MTDLNPAFLDVPIAHRALHDVRDGRPENSHEAIVAAIHAGFGIEIDLQLSKDGEAMVFHDYDLARLTDEKGPIRQRTAAELSSIPLKGGVKGIPTLDSVLETVAGKVPLLIELKDQDGQLGTNIGPLEDATVRALKGYSGPVALMSFNPNSIRYLAEICPGIPRGLVTSAYDPEKWAPVAPRVCDRLREIPDYERAQACFISHEVADLTRERVAQLKSQGAHVLCWTVTSPEAEAEARKVAENITFEQYLPQLPA